MKKKKDLISILTASNNRSNSLKKLYLSLKKQSNKNFEWIIGNDGSTDNTDLLIKSFIREKKIKIKYLHSDIRIGKSKMDNQIFKKVSGEYQIYCGSDDYFKKDAIKNLIYLLKNIPQKYKKKINGTFSQCVDQNNLSQSFYKDKMPNKEYIMKWEEIQEYIKGDCSILEKSKGYKNKKFKEVDFVISESTLMNKVNKGKYFILSPIITTVMKRSIDSISFGKTMRYTRGWAYSVAINSDIKTFKNYNLKKKYFTIINYWRYAYHGDIDFFKAKKMWDVTKNNNFYLFFLPFSCIYIIWDVLTKKIDKTHIEFNKNKNKAKIKYINKI